MLPHACGSQRTACGVIFFFYHVGPKDQTQAARVGDRCLNPMTHLTG